MRVFPGTFLNFDRNSLSAPEERYAPAIEVKLSCEGHSRDVDFLIDTGSEVSILYPQQARALLGDDFESVAARTSHRRELVGGVEGQLNRAFRIPVEMTFFDEDRVSFLFDTTILVAGANPPDLDDEDDIRGNWATPSLLGRDLLLHFDLCVSGSRSEVYLSLPD